MLRTRRKEGSWRRRRLGQARRSRPQPMTSGKEAVAAAAAGCPLLRCCWHRERLRARGQRRAAPPSPRRRRPAGSESELRRTAARHSVTEQQQALETKT